MTKKIEMKDIAEIDLEHSFFHYTNKKNLTDIIKNGLEPRIGENSIYVEKTPKVFFVEGQRGILTIIDVWLKWLTAKGNNKKYIYGIETLYLRMPFCIKAIPNYVVKMNLENKKKRNKAYKKMRDILENSIFLVLELEENIDFSYDDIDEVKSTYYESFLKLLYPKESDLKDKKMEYWNMHTYSSKTIKANKTTVLKDGNKYKANQILIEIIEQNIEKVKKDYQFLYEYYLYLNDFQKKITSL